MKSETLNALAKRAETEEPSRKLEQEIEKARGTTALLSIQNCRRWLHSVDDAKELMPTRWRCERIYEMGVRYVTWTAMYDNRRGKDVMGRANTEAAARCAAALRALAHEATPGVST